MIKDIKPLWFFLLILCLQVSAQPLRNPIIPGFHPDPSVCRVGGDYYLVNSSFEYFPGVPIFHSTDLQNWQQIGNVLDRASQLSLDGATGWQGIYAPTIRYHNGIFYMITTLIGGKGNFMVTASNPSGPWSEPVWLEQQGIDPSLYFEGRKCYMVSNPDNMITLCEIDPKTGRQLTPSQGIWQGTGGRYPEGPHIYKKGGYYYLLISEGGTELAHSVTIARSKNIYGPYEANPANPILTHCSIKGQDGSIQGTGHGDMVEAADGRWYMTFLAYRHYGGSYHHLGRETFIAPVEWTADGWPVVNGNEPIVEHDAPRVSRRYEFDAPLGQEWVFIQNPDSSAYWLHDGKLRLYGSIHDLVTNRQPTFVGVRQQCAQFRLDTKIAAADLADGDEAGVCLYQMHEGHVMLSLSNYRGFYRVRLRLCLKGSTMQLAERTISILDAEDLWMRVTSDGSNYSFYFSTDGVKYQSLNSLACPLLSTETVGGFTGVVVGLYAFMGNTKYQAGRSFVDFDFFDYSEEVDG